MEGTGAGRENDRQSQFSAAAFRSETVVLEREATEREQARVEDAVALEARRREARELLNRHLTETSWRRLLERAEAAAQRGELEFLLHRFDSDLCTDGGRMIDVAEPGWEATLRGEPAEVVERWRRELKPQGFRLVARIVSYVDGVLGDIGLFLIWKN